MNLRNFDLNLLVAFDVLMRECNVSRAAEAMFVSQSAMSHSLNRLRQLLDDPLLVRTGKGMKPTQRALALVEPVRKALEDIEQIVHSPLQFEPKASHRRFVIAGSDYVEYLVIPPLVDRIQKSASSVDLNVDQPDIVLPENQLENGDIDLVLGFQVILRPPPYLRVEPLFTDRMACMVRADHPHINDAISLAQYVEMNHVLISTLPKPTGVIDDWLADMGLSRRVALKVQHFLSAPFIVATTDMILSLPLRIAEQFTRLASLKIVSIPLELPIYEVIMVWHPAYENEPSNAWLREHVRAVCNSFPRPWD